MSLNIMLVLLIISLVVATIIVNAAQQLFMKVLGLSGMMINIKSKLLAILVVGFLISSIVARLFGVA